jgi:hypothetical protein
MCELLVDFLPNQKPQISYLPSFADFCHQRWQILYVTHGALICLNYIQTRILHLQRSGHYERVPGRLHDVHAAEDCRPQAQRDQEPWQGGAGPSSHKTGNCTYRDFRILHSWNSYALEFETFDSNQTW